MFKAEYEANPNWSNEMIAILSERVGVSRTKVYKWNWDRKKKDEAAANQNQLINSEEEDGDQDEEDQSDRLNKTNQGEKWLKL